MTEIDATADWQRGTLNRNARFCTQQAAHPDLTLTGMYNVLEKLRSGEPLTAKEKTIHEQGLVSVLKQLHDDLDAAVFEAYGWPVTLTDEEILERLVALNAERAAEEERGLIRWLRPEFQNPAGGKGAVQKQLDVAEDEEAAKPAKKKPAKAAAVAQALQAARKPVTPADVGQVFMRANSDDVVRLLKMLAAIGKARTIRSGKRRKDRSAGGKDHAHHRLWLCHRGSPLAPSPPNVATTTIPTLSRQPGRVRRQSEADHAEGLEPRQEGSLFAAVVPARGVQRRRMRPSFLTGCRHVDFVRHGRGVLQWNWNARTADTAAAHWTSTNCRPNSESAGRYCASESDAVSGDVIQLRITG